MNVFRWPILWGLVVLLTAAPARAQRGAAAFLPPPHLGYVYPAAGQQGTTLDVTVGGQFLRSASDVHVWGDGLQITIGKYHKPLNAQEYFALQEKVQELRRRFQAQRASSGFGGARALYAKILGELGLTEDDVADFREFGRNAVNPKRQLNVQIAETIVLHVKLAADAAPGQRELRLVSASGLSNPLAFYVGRVPEIRKSESGGTSSETEVEQPLPVALNGQILPGGGADRFAFQARKGARLLAIASARDLLPYLADAVPGWFQATLTLYDPAGQEVAFAEDYRFQPDPVLYYEVPAAGRYVLEIKDALYRGRQDFVYRVVLGEFPFVTSVFPLGGRDADPITVALQGWNLPVKQLTLAAAGNGPGIFPVTLRHEQWVFNRVPFSRDTLPEIFEQEPNDTPQSAQVITPPVVVNGRIDRPGDWDVFRFEGRSGSRVVAEVLARRLGSPLDSILKLTDAQGQTLALNDDYEDKATPLLTHHADSRIAVTLPADGSYYLFLGDTQHKGGAEYAYRLRVAPPRPDFALRVVPSSIAGRAGTAVPITVYALRHDDFDGDISLELKNPPAGFALNSPLLPAHEEKLRLTVTLPATATDRPLNLALQGQALIEGRRVTRTAVPAEDMLQAFAYHQLVPAREWLATVNERRYANVWWRPQNQQRLRLPAGGTARVQFSVPPGPMTSEAHLELSEPPDGVAVKSVAPSRDGVSVVFSADAKKVKAGQRGNLILEASMERPDDGKGKPGAKRRLPLGALPAIAYEIEAR